MSFLASMKEIFLFFFMLSMKSKKAKTFYILSFIPILVLAIAKIYEYHNPASTLTAEQLFTKVLLIMYVQLLIPVLSLLYGSLVISEEVDNKTLVYLTSSPVPKPAILLGKYLAYIALSVIIIDLGLLFCFLIININHFSQMVYVNEFLAFFGVGVLAIMAYSGLFTLLGTISKKSLLVGLVFIFGWENVVQYFPGVTQKLTLMHYIKSLLPQTSETIKFLAFKLAPSSTFESLLVLSLVIIISLIASSLIFLRTEGSTI